MLELVGDIFNWVAAGVLFPLLFLPLGFLFSEKRPLIGWIALVTAIVIAGALFARLTPVLSLTPSVTKIVWFAALLALTAAAAVVNGAKKTSWYLSGLFEVVTHKTGRAVMWLLLAMAVIQFGVVILRYVFGLNYIFMQESITYMHGAVFLLAGGYALLTDDHVRVDIFYREATPRRKALVDLAGTYLLLVPVCLLLLWTASPYVARSWAVGEGSNEASGIQALFILKSFIPAFAVLLLMAGFVIAARAVATLKERG
ncbi:TRAP transporter small permease subunit [Hyphococcus sp.]|jgi:TRAP-type mannitol/chloroaromatic compound transport system permease small subunit|uniref:TRAP transporter small permease subunit n=1 Tax=Hyphococcus sp. TaxID=2038636 RepID=UPI003D097172